MTREEAIVVLNVVDENASCDDCLYYNQMEDCPADEDCIIRQALWMAISALEHICDNDCEHCTWTECPINEQMRKENGMTNKEMEEDVYKRFVEPYHKFNELKPCEDAKLEQIRAEILNTFLWENETEENLNYSVRKCLEIIDKYTNGGMSPEVKEHYEQLAEHYNKKGKKG